MKNTAIYNKMRTVPEEAKKQITAGRLKGFTDINPMWRIKRLTEIFGPCGFGWWYEIESRRIETDETTKQKAAFVDILLYCRDPETGEASHGIPGTGGAAFVTQEKAGAYMSDECFKMALTDAISVAAKALGCGADVYFAKDRDKYTGAPEDPAPVRCPDCGKEIKRTRSNGKIYEPADILKQLGKCPACYRKDNQNKEGAPTNE